MSEATAEAGRGALKALSRGDLAALIDLSHTDVEWQSFFASVGQGGTYRGHDGLRQYMNDLSDAFDFIHADVDDDIAIGNVVVLLGRVHYRGKESGVELEVPAGWMLKFRQGKVEQFRAFRDPEAALEAVGSGARPG
jgi:uncharacterized protein